MVRVAELAGVDQASEVDALHGQVETHRRDEVDAVHASGRLLVVDRELADVEGKTAGELAQPRKAAKPGRSGTQRARSRDNCSKN